MEISGSSHRFILMMVLNDERNSICLFSPKSSRGKIFCIFYGLIGIPICAIFLASTSDHFSNSFLHLYERQQRKFQKDKRLGIFFAAILFFIPGLAVFLFIPAAISVVIVVRSITNSLMFCFLKVRKYFPSIFLPF